MNFVCVSYLDLTSTLRFRDELVAAVNSPTNLTEERKELTRERLRDIGAIPKIAFCRLENFR